MQNIFGGTDLTAAQKEARKKVVCGSDTPCILGHGYQNSQEIYYIKKGVRDDDLSENRDVRRGKRHENLVAWLYQKETGRKLTKPRGMLYSKRHPWLGGNPDRFISCKDRGRGILEIKCPGEFAFRNMENEGRAPLYYLIQLQHYLIVTRRQWGAMAIYCANTDELIHFDVDWNATLAGKILKRTKVFYEDLMADRIPVVERELLEPAPLIKDGIAEITDDSDLLNDITAMEEADELRAKYEAIYKEKMEAIKNRVGHNKQTNAFGWKFTHKMYKGRRTLDVDRLLHDYPEFNLNKYAPLGPDAPQFRKAKFNG